MFETFLNSVNTVIGSGEAAASAGAAAETTTQAAAGGGLSMSWIFFYIIVIFAAMYFMSIRPQKKRQRQMEEMRTKIKPGDSVLCNTGMYGRVVDVTAECFIVEFGMNKGVRVPVIKSEIAMVKEPNLSNKEEPEPEEEKKGLFGRKKKAAEPAPKAEEAKAEEKKAEEAK